METLEVIPDPISLMESMRAIGYTLEAAVADLIDNSISANADRVDILYDSVAEPFLAILDNGDGMTPDVLTNAMRHGSTRPSEKRKPSDLGRFGLGLKTASLSQCRQLTVISKRDGAVHARRWDLDVVEDTQRWFVVVPGIDELRKMPGFRALAERDHGTLVVWQSLDRLTAGASDPQKEMKAKIAPLFEHLALVFHRFYEREQEHKAVGIHVNGLQIPRRDPFLRDNSFRQPLECQTIQYEKGTVVITPVILPPINHLTRDEIALAGGEEGLRGTQGFYIDRSRRLVIWGTWFRLVPKEEFRKLTRVQVDIPNSFDDLWSLDIKKSAAHPPELIRSRLRDLIPHFASTSHRTVTYAGRRNKDRGAAPLWIRTEPSHGRFRYDVNPEHPRIMAVAELMEPHEQSSFESLLQLMANSLPLDMIYADLCSDGRTSSTSEDLEEVLDVARTLRQVLKLPVAEVLKLDPLCRYPQHHAQILEKLSDGI